MTRGVAVMDKVVVYIHGKGGDPGESVHYEPLFCGCDVIGLDYTAQFPWEAKEEFPRLFDSICKKYGSVEVIANSIGAFLRCMPYRISKSRRRILFLLL